MNEACEVSIWGVEIEMYAICLLQSSWMIIISDMKPVDRLSSSIGSCTWHGEIQLHAIQSLLTSGDGRPTEHGYKNGM